MNLNKILVAIVLAQCFSAYASPTPKPPKKVVAAQVADESPRAIPAARESRIVRYTFSPDVIFRVMTQPTLHTHLELGEDEGIVEMPMVGDRIEWKVSGGPRNIYIKPLHNDLETSLTLVTNKRVYQLQLISGAKNSQVYQKVSFDYPDVDQALQLRQEQESAKEAKEQSRLASQIVGPDVDPSSLNFEYNIIGNAEFKPTVAYTNGTMTWLRLPNTQDTPAVFLVDEHGNPQMINYKVDGNLIIIERFAKQLLLKLNEAEVKVVLRQSKSTGGRK